MRPSEAAGAVPGNDCSRPMPDHSAELLADLVNAHDELTAALAEMAEVTAEARPDATRFPQARWKLSQASRRRRAVVGAACDKISRSAGPAERTAIDQLRAEDTYLLRASAAHVQQWTRERIVWDWQAYCSASRGIRNAMSSRIDSERVLLYPLLRKY